MRVSCCWLFFLNHDAMSIGISVVTDPSDLPRDSHSWPSSRDKETIAFNFTGHIYQRRTPNRSKLIAKILVQRLKIIRQRHLSPALAVQDHHAIVDVLHIRRLHKRMLQILMSRIEWVVNAERTPCLREKSIDGQVAIDSFSAIHSSLSLLVDDSSSSWSTGKKAGNYRFVVVGADIDAD